MNIFRTSPRRKPASSRSMFWMPAFAGMTAIMLLSLSLGWAGAPPGGYFNQGMDLYKAGRNADAVEAFEQAVKRKDSAHQAQEYIDRIRKETVERIRDKALTGVN